MNIKAKQYIKKWIKILRDIKSSEEGFSIRSIREDRENH
jgi:hypothetical protein